MSQRFFEAAALVLSALKIIAAIVALSRPVGAHEIRKCEGATCAPSIETCRPAGADSGISSPPSSRPAGHITGVLPMIAASIAPAGALVDLFMPAIIAIAAGILLSLLMGPRW